MNELTFKAQQWVGYRDDGGLSTDMATLIKNTEKEDSNDGKTSKKPTKTGNGGGNNNGNDGSGGGGGGENNGGTEEDDKKHSKADFKYEWKDGTYHYKLPIVNGKVANKDDKYLEVHEWKKFGASFRCKKCKRMALSYTPGETNNENNNSDNSSTDE